MNITFSRIFDGITSLFITFFTSAYLLLPKFGALSWLIALALAFSLSALWLKLISKKKKPISYQKYLPFFRRKTPSSVARFLEEKIRNRYPCRGFGSILRFKSGDLIALIKYAPLSPDHATAIALGIKRKTLLVVSAVEKDTLTAVKATAKPLKIMTFDAFAAILDKLGALPVLENKPKRRLFTEFFSVATQPPLAKKYLSATAILLFLSAINGFSPYYLAFAFLPLALSLTCFLRAKSAEN